MKHQRTFRLDKLWHGFLKPHGVEFDRLNEFAEALESQGFIETRQPNEKSNHSRYVELEPLKRMNRNDRNEVFKIIFKLKEAQK